MTDDERSTDSRVLITREWAAAPTTPVFERDRAAAEALNAELGDRAATSQVLENTSQWFRGAVSADEKQVALWGIMTDAMEAQTIARQLLAEREA